MMPLDLQRSMEPFSKRFAALEAAVNGLDAFLKLQAFDLTPVILTQPPPNRDSRREYLKAALDSLDPQLVMIQELDDRIGVARKIILRHRSMAYLALQPVSAIPSEVLQTIFSYLHGRCVHGTHVESRCRTFAPTGARLSAAIGVFGLPHQSLAQVEFRSSRCP